MPKKPTKQELTEATSKTIRDVIDYDLDVLFCGINPGLYSAAIGHHFGRPGNRFWPALHLGGFTPRQYDPSEDGKLLELGYGITNVVTRTSARADELAKEELTAGAVLLQKKVLKYKPRFLAVLGIVAYRQAFSKPMAQMGEQEAIGSSRVWVLPNPSGLNAHVQIADLKKIFSEFREIVYSNSDGPNWKGQN
jgi:TDG/mug DNA glycosylase family protein